MRNAIQIAALLAKEQTMGSPLLGRIPPIFLVGEGAREWAKSKDIGLPPSIAEANEKGQKHNGSSTNLCLKLLDRRQ